MSAREQIIYYLSSIIYDLVREKVEVKLEVPEDSNNGDYSTNIALQLAKKLGKSPRALAETIRESVWRQAVTGQLIEKVEVAGAGFLNFYLSDEYLISSLGQIPKQREKYGHSTTLKGKKVMIEFTDPNPLKEFHIGHVYSNTVGESIARLFESQEADVWRVNYQGDVGLHAAKALWGIMNNELRIKDIEDKSLSEKAKFLGQAYALGSRVYEEQPEAKEEINSINKKVYDKDPDIYPLYEQAKQWSLEYFEELYTRLGTKFKRYYFESEVGPIGAALVKEHIGDVFEEEGGAIILSKEKSGLHTRVFINSLGLPTYEAKELGLAPTKYKDFPYDTSIIITGNEINEYFKVLIKALSMINPDLAAKTKHLSHGMVRLPTGKMSSRTGYVITGEWLLNAATEKLLAAFPEMNSDVSEKLAIGSVKYAMLKSGIGADIAFSFEESINLQGNSGPYLQYAYVRTQSILSKVKNISTLREQKLEVKSEIQKLKLDSDEKALLRKLINYPEVVEFAAGRLAPSDLCTYLFEIAQAFNLFYQKAPILKSGEREALRLAITDAVGIILQNGLTLLGIKTVEKM